MNTQEQQLIQAKQQFQNSIQDRFQSTDLQINPETPDSEGFVMGNADGSKRVRAVFRCEQDQVCVDLFRPLGVGWDNEPFEKGLTDFDRASFSVHEELQRNEQKIQ
ncbi:hypothetical protein [Deinococcus misasensis]|uniref:hypothetical protein n=1 Tax=Deinococcus misasensis TaxID=392413 RepID=UPI000A659BC4|nr:hypothetical protein [Deinococcus misasensis]